MQRKKDKQNNKGLMTRPTEKVGFEVFNRLFGLFTCNHNYFD